MKKVKTASEANKFEQIINIGPAAADDFRKLGFSKPSELTDQDPTVLYRNICEITESFHDPCVLDVMIATVDFMNGGKPQQWWAFTDLRKQRHGDVVEEMRARYA